MATSSSKKILDILQDTIFKNTGFLKDSTIELNNENTVFLYYIILHVDNGVVRSRGMSHVILSSFNNLFSKDI